MTKFISAVVFTFALLFSAGIHPGTGLTLCTFPDPEDICFQPIIEPGYEVYGATFTGSIRGYMPLEEVPAED